MIRKGKRPEDGVSGLGGLIDQIIAKQHAILVKKGYKKLDYRIDGDQMWQGPDGEYKRESKLVADIDLQKESGGGEHA